jgi:Protein of unknown function (DUF1573)
MNISVVANNWRGFRSLVACSVVFTVGCGPRADISRSVNSYDAGYVLHERTPELSHVFTFTNTSQRTIAITNVTKSCGCAQVSVDRHSLRPDETAQVTVVIGVS